MHRALTIALAALLLGLLASPARAGGQLKGEGFKVSVPPGFRRLGVPENDGGLSGRMRLTGGLSVKGKPDVHVFLVGPDSRPDAVFIAARIDFADGARMRSRLDLQRYVMDNLRLSEKEFDALVAAGGVKLTQTRRSDYDALEMAHDGSRGALGLLNEPATRALTVLGGEFVIVLVLMVVDDSGVPVEETWQHISRSLVIDPRGAFLKSALLYGGLGLVGLILLVFFMRVRAQRRTHRTPWASSSRMSAGIRWSEDMLSQPLQPAGGPPPDARRDPVQRGRGTALPLPGQEPAPTVPQPSSEPEPPFALPSSAAAQVRHASVPQQAPSAVPAPAPDEEPPMPAAEIERPLPPPSAAPPRKGLIRTRPQGRRYSQ